MLLAVLLALAVRIAIPSGFMLEPAAGAGLPHLVICSGMGALMPAAAHDAGMMDHAVMDHQSMDHQSMGHHEAGHHETSKHAPPATGEHDCPFAAAATVLAVPDLAAPVVLGVVSTIVLLAPAFVYPGRGLAAPPPPSTGPPASA